MARIAIFAALWTLLALSGHSLAATTLCSELVRLQDSGVPAHQVINGFLRSKAIPYYERLSAKANDVLQGHKHRPVLTEILRSSSMNFRNQETEVMDRAIADSPPWPKDMPLFRGVKLEKRSREKWKQDLLGPVGSQFFLKGYQSTTLSLRMASSYASVDLGRSYQYDSATLRFIPPRGKSLIGIFYPYCVEKEVVLGRNLQVELARSIKIPILDQFGGISHHHYFIDLRVLTNGPSWIRSD